MKRLEKQVRKNRFDYKQIFCQPTADGKNVYIYEQYSDEGVLIGHEVFVPRIQKNDIKAPTGYIIPAGEKFPGDREFGISAWSITSRERAFDKAQELVEKHGELIRA